MTTTVEQATFDVFLSHNGRDKPAVEYLALKLKRAGLEPWLDTWCIRAPAAWQEELSGGLLSSSACAFFFGPSDVGDWQRMELFEAQQRAAKDFTFHLFPVLLPGLSDPFDATALPPFLRMRTYVDFRSGIDDVAAFHRLVCAIKGIAPGPTVEVAPRDDVCPYRGLESFTEAQAEFFFGRDADIQRLLEKLKEQRFLAVLGPSGSGKSSLVRAGVLPAIHRGALPGSYAWTICTLTPGASPLTALGGRVVQLLPDASMQTTVDDLLRDERTLHFAASLALTDRPAEDRVVWVIDQFEEVFTLCADEDERTQFLANLVYAASAPGSRCVILLTMRADFYPRCAAHPELAQQIASHQYLVGPLGAESLREVIQEPARRVGLELEAGLVSAILRDIGSTTAALPLLEFALLELWKRRRHRMLTLEAYEETGGVQGSIARTAEDLYGTMSPVEHAVARRVLLRLTQLGEGTDDTRRRAPLDELVTSGRDHGLVESVIDSLVRTRLLTIVVDPVSGTRWLDIAHEALIRGWPRLRSWIDDDRAGLLLLGRLTAAAQQWEEAKDDSYLYRGAALASALEWAEQNPDTMSVREAHFLECSQAQQRQQERSARRRVRILFAVMSAALVIITGFAVLALHQQQVAEQQRTLAISDTLVTEAAAQMDNDPEQSIGLARQALLTAPTSLAASTLRQAVSASHVRAVLRGHTGPMVTTASSPDGRLVAATSLGGTYLWSLFHQHGGTLVRMLDRSDDTAVAFSPDGRVLASTGGNGRVHLWTVRSPTAWMRVPQLQETDLRVPTGVSSDLGFTSSGRLRDATAGGTVSTWSLEHKPNGDVPRARARVDLPGLPGRLLAVALSPDGRYVMATDSSGLTHVWDSSSRRMLGHRFPCASQGTIYACSAISFHDRWIATICHPRFVCVWDLADGRQVITPLVYTADLTSIGFSPNGLYLVTTSVDHTTQLWSWEVDDSPVAIMRGDTSIVNRAAFGPDGREVVTASDDGTARVWDLGLGDVFRQILTPQRLNSVDVDRSGRYLVTTSLDTGEVQIWDATRGISSGPAVTSGPSISAATFAPDGMHVLVVGPAGSAQEWNLMTRTPDLTLHMAGTVTASIYSGDGRSILTGSSRGEVQRWRAGSGASDGQPLTVPGAVHAVALSPDGHYVAAAGTSVLRIWTTTSAAASRTQQIDLAGLGAGGATAVAFSPNGREVAVAVDHAVRVWDAMTGAPVSPILAAHNDRVNSVAFDPTGAFLLTTSDDETARIWDTTQWVSIATLHADINKVTDGVFSADGRRVITSSDDGVIQIYRCDVCVSSRALLKLASSRTP